MLQELINFISPSIEHIHFLGYWVAFFAALIETTLGIGLFLPGSTIILFLGALSSRGYLDTVGLIWFAVAGALLGDNINYYLGKKYGAKWIGKGFWFLKSDYVKKAQSFMDAHGAKSVFFGRFVPSVKEIVPFIAGSVEMNKRTFMLWNFLGAAGWGIEWVLAGYIFAQSLNLAEVWLSRAGLFFAFLVIIGILLYTCKWLITKKGTQFWIITHSLWYSIQKAITQNEHVALWIKKHPRCIAFLQARLNTEKFSGLPLSLFTFAFIYVLTLFAGIVEDLITTDSIIAADIRIANLAAALRTETLTTFFTWITLLGKSQVIITFIIVSMALLWLWRKKPYIAALLISVCGSETFTSLGKLAFHRARPALAVYAEKSFSFPSGHATIAVAFYGFMGYLLMRVVRSWNAKINVFFGTVCIIIAIGFSRVYLGEHYISDVWSGYLVGSMWLIIAVSFSEWLSHTKNDIQAVAPARGAGPLSFVCISFALLFYIVFSTQYTPPPATVPLQETVVVSHITDVFTNEQVKYTETILGDRQEPINIIFFARKDQLLLTALQQAGWVATDKATLPAFTKAVKALLLQKPYPHAPLSPAFCNARTQDMSFAKVSGTNWLSNAHHLKLWRTNFALKNGNTIYLGLVNSNDGLKWGIIPTISPDLNADRESLYQDLQATGKIESSQKIKLVPPQIEKNFLGDHFFTDGDTYIIQLQ
ncbi:LssY C-terminal domain-containing protein [Desulfogranum japonicum]|uniref:LssY C-terminal domain-containing protein n=1 Tax=Desulfogranum japonicum TaxID=231447 RepID=UPI00041026A9|nr:LssY C-terminal domain-containing protein [Desulfogranum japonicum]